MTDKIKDAKNYAVQAQAAQQRISCLPLDPATEAYLSDLDQFQYTLDLLRRALPEIVNTGPAHTWAGKEKLRAEITALLTKFGVSSR